MSPRPGPRLLHAIVFALLTLSGTLQAAAPTVLVSIKPIHSLVAGVMTGVGEPILLISGSDSPHSFTLRPSTARKLNNAELIFWVGESLESPLESILSTVNGRVVELLKTEDIVVHPPRKGGSWESQSEVEVHDDHHEHSHDHHEGNPHIWLSPINGQAIVTLIEQELSAIDPNNAARYRENAINLRQRLQQLDKRLEKQLSGIRKQPYIVFHDAYQAFEDHYRLNATGSVTLNPDRMPGAKRIHQLRKRIDAEGVRCLFSEPQFKPKLVHTLVDGTTARSGVLDPLGSDLVPGPDAYFQLMHNLADALVECLDR
ncbi:MAG: zinc ABC transporter substrate-binding protein [Candidatus Sedimenticola sp. (ex Thyasira tokunagai)]